MEISIGYGFAVLLLVVVAAMVVKSKKRKSKKKSDDLEIKNVHDAMEVIKRNEMLNNIISNYDVSVVKNLKAGKYHVWGSAHSDTIFLDRDYVVSATVKQVVSLILHELGHLVMGHTTQDLDDEAAAFQYSENWVKVLYS